MKIKIKMGMTGLPRGCTVELPDKEAQQLLNIGAAELVTATQFETREKAIRKPRETR